MRRDGAGKFPLSPGKSAAPRCPVPGARCCPRCPVPVPSPEPPRAALPPAPPGGRFVGSPVPPRRAAGLRGREGGAGGRGAAPGGAPGAVEAVGARGARQWGRTPCRPLVRARREHGVIHPGGFCLRDKDTFMIQPFFLFSLIHFFFRLFWGFAAARPPLVSSLGWHCLGTRCSHLPFKPSKARWAWERGKLLPAWELPTFVSRAHLLGRKKCASLELVAAFI